MRKLEVGDKVVLIQETRYGRTYCFETVDRVTGKQAHTGLRTKLNREPIDNEKVLIYKSINAGTKQYWKLVNEEILEQFRKDQEAYKEKNKISNWWINFRPDDETKSKLYYMFNPKQ